jgi:hypothetical protein
MFGELLWRRVDGLHQKWKRKIGTKRFSVAWCEKRAKSEGHGKGTSDILTKLSLTQSIRYEVRSFR